MDLTTKQWLIGIIITIIIVILIDGFRRMRKARQDSLYMSLDPKKSPSLDDRDIYGSEFPNGGARISDKAIDPERIQQVKSQYDFGRELNIPVKPKTGSSEPTEENYSHDQWVDAEDGDEDYYASQWDEDSTEEELDVLEEPIENTDDAMRENQNTQAEAASLSANASEMSAPLADTSVSPAISDPSDLDSDTDKPSKKRPDDVIDDMPATPSTELFQVIETEEDLVSATEEYQEPTQVPLNLEEAVPVLMDSLDDDVDQSNLHTDERVDHKAASQQSLKEEKKNSEKPDASDRTSVKESLKPAPSIQAVGKHIEPTIGDDALEIETHSANKPRFESKYFASHSQSTKTNTPDPSSNASSDLEEVLVIHVKARKGTEFYGNDILQQVLENGMRYGAMNIFHRHQHDDGEGPVIFSMTNMLKPGIFDLKSIDELSTVGVTFFMTLPVYDNNNMAAFELMISAAKNIAKALDGELNDENRSVMTGQTIEHYRERIRDFSRKQQLAKHK